LVPFSSSPVPPLALHLPCHSLGDKLLQRFRHRRSGWRHCYLSDCCHFRLAHGGDSNAVIRTGRFCARRCLSRASLTFRLADRKALGRRTATVAATARFRLGAFAFGRLHNITSKRLANDRRRHRYAATTVDIGTGFFVTAEFEQAACLAFLDQIAEGAEAIIGLAKSGLRRLMASFRTEAQILPLSPRSSTSASNVSMAISTA
jgi:hypothetical protein